MTNGSASLAHVLTLAQLLATLKVLLWRRFEARPYVGTEDGETYECIALDLDGVPTAYVSPDGPAFTVQLEVGLMRAEVA